MTGWAAKRFWTAAEAVACDGGFTVRLDGRAVKTPARRLLVMPTLAMAQTVAAEWDAQTGLVAPETMPCTRSANSALDKVTPQFDEVVGLLAAYGATDLLCYRATGPAALTDLQTARWSPVLEWAAAHLGAPLRVTSGVVPVEQPPDSLARLTARVAAMSAFELVGFHDLVAISGSLVLGLSVTEGRLAAKDAWALSRIDETWQAENWGHDEEAAEAEVRRREGFLQAERFYRLCR